MIVVFGAGGQLGQELTAMAAADEVRLTGVTEEEADITDRGAVDRVLRDCRASLVINAAAYNFVDKAESEPNAAIAANAEGPGVVAAACAEAGLSMIHISSDFVFDGEKTGPYREVDPVAPLNVYGVSKAKGEAAVRRGCPHHLIIRTAWLFGVHGSNFLKTVLRLAGERDEISVVADQRGTPTSTPDLARAILAAAATVAGGAPVWGTYHFAGSGETSWHGLASRIVAARAPFASRTPTVRAITTADYPSAAIRPKNSALDSSKFATVFAVHAIDWQTAVDRTVAQLLSGRAPV